LPECNCGVTQNAHAAPHESGHRLEFNVIHNTGSALLVTLQFSGHSFGSTRALIYERKHKHMSITSNPSQDPDGAAADAVAAPDGPPAHGASVISEQQVKFATAAARPVMRKGGITLCWPKRIGTLVTSLAGRRRPRRRHIPRHSGFLEAAVAREIHRL
jgi:hypothetical protein